MYKHYKKLVGFEFIALTKDQFEFEKNIQLGLFGTGSVMFHKESDTIVLLPVEDIRTTVLTQDFYPETIIDAIEECGEISKEAFDHLKSKIKK